MAVYVCMYVRESSKLLPSRVNNDLCLITKHRELYLQFTLISEKTNKPTRAYKAALIGN